MSTTTYYYIITIIFIIVLICPRCVLLIGPKFSKWITYIYRFDLFCAMFGNVLYLFGICDVIRCRQLLRLYRFIIFSTETVHNQTKLSVDWWQMRKILQETFCTNVQWVISLHVVFSFITNMYLRRLHSIYYIYTLTHTAQAYTHWWRTKNQTVNGKKYRKTNYTLVCSTYATSKLTYPFFFFWRHLPII